MKAVRQRIAKALMGAVMAGTVAATMGMSAMAGTIGGNGTYTGSDTTIYIPKGIVVVNDGFTKTYTPNITYSFTATPATVAAGTTVTDANNNGMGVEPGQPDGLSNGQAVFTKQEVVESDANATSLQEELVANAAFEVDLSKFDHAGVYRYTITDVTEASVLYNAGITRTGDYDATRELDLYIIKDSTSGQLAVAGAVLTDDLPGNITKDDGSGYKVPGFVTENPGPGDVIRTVNPGEDGIEGTADDKWNVSFGGLDTGDRYISYNLVVEKQITGNMSDPNHAFPFSFTVTGNDGHTTPVEIYTGSALDAVTVDDDGQFSANLKDKAKAYLCGLSPFAVLEVSERNDTINPYKVTTSDGTYSAQSVTPGEFATITGMKTSDYDTKNSASLVNTAPQKNSALDLTVENNLAQPSTTGILMRVAPFAAAAALIGGLFVAMKVKTKKGTEES